MQFEVCMIDIVGLIKKINMMDDNKERAIKISTLYSYISFLHASKQISDEEFLKLV